MMNLESDEKNLPQKISEDIISFILNEHLQPGDKLPNEAHLAKELNIGRSSLREAMKLLASRNIVTIRQGSGTYVATSPGVIDDPLGFTFISDKKKLLAIMKNDPGAFRADLGYFRTSPTKPFMGPSVRNAPPVFRARVLKDSPMIALGGTSDKSKGFLVQFKSKHIGMVQRQLGIPADKDYTESGKKRWKPNEKLATLSSPSGSAMHHTVWEMQEQTVEQMLQQNTERRVRQLIANAKRKGVI